MNKDKIFKGKRIDTKEWVSGYLVETPSKAYIILSAETDCTDGENTDLYATDWYEVYPDTVCRNSKAEDNENCNVIKNRLAAKKKELARQQEHFKVDLQNIERACYEDNAINALISMKKLKSEISELELVLQLVDLLSSKESVLSKEECDIFNVYLQGDIRIAFGNTDWNHIYRKIVGENSSNFAENCMETALE